MCYSGRVYRVAVKCTTSSCIDCCISSKIIFTSSSCRTYMLSGTLVLVRCTSSMRWTHSVTRRMSLLWRLAGTRLKWSARTSVTENREHLSPFYRYVIWWSYFFVQLFVPCLIPSFYTFHNVTNVPFHRGEMWRVVLCVRLCMHVGLCYILPAFEPLIYMGKYGMNVMSLVVTFTIYFQ